MKRWRARARGRAARIRKPTCHITIKLTPVERQLGEPAAAPKQEEPQAEGAAPEKKPAPKRKPAAKKPKKTEEAES